MASQTAKDALEIWEKRLGNTKWRAALFRKLNGLDMGELLDTLVALEKRGFRVGESGHDPYLKVAGVHVQRLKLAMAAVKKRGLMSPGVFVGLYASWVASVPFLQQQQIWAFLVAHLPQVAVYASGPDAPGMVCEDARLRNHDKSSVLGLGYPPKEPILHLGDATYGQKGWDIGINYDTTKKLAEKMNKRLELPEGGRKVIRRLGINCHGLPGKFFINGAKNPPLTEDSSTYEEQLGAIRDRVSSSGVVLLLGCNSGLDKAGTKFLISLSKFFPGRTVVGFATVGFMATDLQKRPGDTCSEPGMRDTEQLWPVPRNQAAEHAAYIASGKWEDLEKQPWASENSPRAKAALNGEIVRGGNW